MLKFKENVFVTPLVAKLSSSEKFPRKISRIPPEDFRDRGKFSGFPGKVSVSRKLKIRNKRETLELLNMRLKIN